MKYYIFDLLYYDDSLSVSGETSNDIKADESDARQSRVVSADYLEYFEFRVGQFGKSYDLLANNLSWHLVSSEVKRVIQSFCLHDEVQFLPFIPPADTRWPNSKDYFLMNPLRIIDCIDLENSSVRYNTNDIGRRYISSVFDLCLKSDSIAVGDNMFRLKGLETYLIVNEKIVDKFTNLHMLADSFTYVKTS